MSQKRTLARLMLHPKNWGTALALLVLRSLCALPYAVSMAVGRRMGLIAYWLMKKRGHIARVNLQLCFPDKSDSEREQLLKQHFASLGMGIIEMGLAWWASDQKIQQLFSVEGAEYVKQALAQGKGILLIGAHFTTLDLTGRMLGMTGMQVSVNYRKSKNLVIDEILKQNRESFFAHAIDRHDIRGFLRILKKNGIMWYAPDQDYGRKYSVFAPFFGQNAATITATARFAKMSGATVIPIQYYRRADQKGYIIKFSPPVSNYPGENETDNATKINQVIEQAVLTCPEQYYWVHRRFKTQPPGLARPY